MKKYLYLLILVFIFSFCQTAVAELNAYYLPESGFLRVQGQVTIDPSKPPLYFLLFPHAQITEFWLEGLRHYQVDRGPQGTLVNFSVEDSSSSAKLQIAYEGFLELAGPEIQLNRDSLWFPEFSFPIKTPKITLELPGDWNVISPAEPTKGTKNGTAIFSWKLETGYPALIVYQGDVPVLPNEKKQIETEAYLTKEDGNGRKQVEKQGQPQEFLARLQIQVTRLMNAINNRNEAQIANLVTTELQNRGLPSYLASYPLSFGKLKADFLTTPSSFAEPFELILTTQTGDEFLASVQWGLVAEIPLLEKFTLKPYSQPLPPELLDSFQMFVNDLRQSVRIRQITSLERLIKTQDGSKQICDFINSLNPWVPWKIKYASLEPLSITVFVPHSDTIHLLLNIGLEPGEENWLINTFEVLPLP